MHVVHVHEHASAVDVGLEVVGSLIRLFRPVEPPTGVSVAPSRS